MDDAFGVAYQEPDQSGEAVPARITLHGSRQRHAGGGECDEREKQKQSKRER